MVKQIVKNGTLGDVEYNVFSITDEKRMNINPIVSCRGTTHVFLLPIFFEYLIETNDSTDTVHQLRVPTAFLENKADYKLQTMLADYKKHVVFEEEW